MNNNCYRSDVLAVRVGKRISREHFFESMKLILVAFIILLALMAPAQCQQTAEDWFNKGSLLFQSGKYSESIDAWNEAIKLNSNYSDAWLNKGGALDLLGDYEGAIKCYDNVLMIDPDGPMVWIFKGDSFDELGKYDAAIKCYDTARSINRAYNTESMYMGNSHYDAGEYVAAIRYYDEAIKKDLRVEYPRYNETMVLRMLQHAWYNKAQALRMLHRDSEAKAAYTKARELGYNGPMTQMEMTA